MTKQHLPARPATGGARRLAWRLLDGPADERPARRAALHRRGFDDMAIDRLLHGELTPGAELGIRITLATEYDVVIADWYDEAAGVWADRPAERQQPRRAA